MKEEIYKAKLESFRSTKQYDRSDLSQDHGLNYSSKYPYFQFESTFADEKTFIENFGNPLFHILKEYIMVVVEKNGDKVSLKIFYGRKIRNPGLFWFKTTKNCDFLSVNLKTGNVYQGSILNYQKKRKYTKKIKCNFFLNSPLDEQQNKLKRFSKIFKQTNSEFYTSPIQAFINLIDQNNNFKLSPNNRLLKFHYDKKQIKYPNNFYLFPQFFVGNEIKKLLKKNQNRLVESVMIHFKVNGARLRKVLHEVSNINLINYLTFKSIFGEDWLNQDELLLKQIIESTKNFNITFVDSETFKSLATKKEKRNSFNLLKDSLTTFSVDFYTLADHFRFWCELKRYGDNQTVWKSDGTSDKFFREEHLDWSDKLDHYRKGYYERIYPSVYSNLLSDFEHEGIRYFPVLLISSSDYNEESSIQSNCVKGYIGRCSSVIVSLRRDSNDSVDRLTVEYSLSRIPDLKWVVMKRIQTKAKFNSEPSSDWTKPLQILDSKINEISLHKEFTTHGLKKTCNNGIILESKSEFDDKGNLKWSHNPIDQSILTDYFF
jgi:hypothetical protein